MLTSRQEAILRLIVESHVHTTLPISSEAIARHADLRVSPATVRNEVAELEKQGYITRPHTSAGSVPTDKGYRQYVSRLLSAQTTSAEARFREESLRQQLLKAQQDLEEWTSAAAAVLSRMVGNLAIATFPKAPESRVRHLEVVPLQDVLALLIVVLEHAQLRRQLIRLAAPAGCAELERSANRIKEIVIGQTRRQIQTTAPDLSVLEEAVMNTTLVILKEEDRSIYRGHYLDGLRNLLTQPEFSGNQRVRPVVEAVEDGSLAQAVLDEAPEGVTVRVVIGQENKGELLWPLSVVIAQYGVPGETVGAIGAVGPTRMEYPRTIASVKAMTAVMSELAEDIRSR
jgi:heat-inducible transcriptional repressor